MLFSHTITQISSFKALKHLWGFINLSGRKKEVSRRFSNPHHNLKEEPRSIPQINIYIYIKAANTGTNKKIEEKKWKMKMITFLVTSKCRSYRNGSILSFKNCKYNQRQVDIYLNWKELNVNPNPTILKRNHVENNKYKTIKNNIILFPESHAQSAQIIRDLQIQIQFGVHKYNLCIFI